MHSMVVYGIYVNESMSMKEYSWFTDNHIGRLGIIAYQVTRIRKLGDISNLYNMMGAKPQGKMLFTYFPVEHFLLAGITMILPRCTITFLIGFAE